MPKLRVMLQQSRAQGKKLLNDLLVTTQINSEKPMLKIETALQHVF